MAAKSRRNSFNWALNTQTESCSESEITAVKWEGSAADTVVPGQADNQECP